MNKQLPIRRSAAFVAFAALVASCGSGSGPAFGENSTSTEPEPTVTEASSSEPEPSATAAGEEPDEVPAETSAPDDTSVDTSAPEPDAEPPAADNPDDFNWRGPATGEPLVIGMVNTEGTPGLDFPELRTDTDLAVEWLNAHGGMGGRPVAIEHCAGVGSPETSQACAQELAGKRVEFVMLGLDLFPGYDTFEASGIPVFGALPILPGDYTANALFVSGGNVTTMGMMAGLAVEHFNAQSVGIISADNPGANGSEAALIAALDKAGLPYVSVKGGDNETDAGFQGLLREANKDNPDVLVSLYSDAGCIGAIRGRVSLGISTPMISTPICASADVIDVVGDDAVGWFFVAAGALQDPATDAAFTEIIAPVYDPSSSVSLGLGALGITQVMTLARVANRLADSGDAVTGPAMFDYLRDATDVRDFPNGNVLDCGLAEAYPSVCSFEFPAGEYVAGGEVVTVPGFEAFSVVPYLP